MYVRHGAAHLCDHHLDCCRVECVRLVRLKRQHRQRVVHLLARLSINLRHDKVFLLRLTVALWGRGLGPPTRFLALEQLQVLVVKQVNEGAGVLR